MSGTNSTRHSSTTKLFMTLDLCSGLQWCVYSTSKYISTGMFRYFAKIQLYLFRSIHTYLCMYPVVLLLSTDMGHYSVLCDDIGHLSVDVLNLSAFLLKIALFL